MRAVGGGEGGFTSSCPQNIEHRTSHEDERCFSVSPGSKHEASLFLPTLDLRSVTVSMERLFLPFSIPSPLTLTTTGLHVKGERWPDKKRREIWSFRCICLCVCFSEYRIHPCVYLNVNCSEHWVGKGAEQFSPMCSSSSPFLFCSVLFSPSPSLWLFIIILLSFFLRIHWLCGWMCFSVWLELPTIRHREKELLFLSNFRDALCFSWRYIGEDEMRFERRFNGTDAMS